MYGQCDLRSFCSTGDPVTFQGVSMYSDGVPILGLFDRPVQMRLMEMGVGGVETPQPSVTLPCNAFNPMPQQGDTILVSGVAYTVEQPTAEDDGAMLTYQLNLA